MVIGRANKLVSHLRAVARSTVWISLASIRCRVSPLLHLAAGATVAGAMLGNTCQADELYHDFRKERFDPRTYQVLGEADSKHVRPEPEGLRLMLPAAVGQSRPTGVGARARLSGDFEITAKFEIIKVDQPRSGYGAGFSIYASIDSPTQDAVSISWVRRPKEGTVYVAHQASGASGQSRRQRAHFAEAQHGSGILRLSRRGEVIAYSVSDGPDAEFREIWRTGPVQGDVSSLRLTANNGGASLAVDVRLDELTIRADRILTGQRSQHLSVGNALIAVGVVSVASAGAVWCWKALREQANRTIKAEGRGVR